MHKWGLLKWGQVDVPLNNRAPYIHHGNGLDPQQKKHYINFSSATQSKYYSDLFMQTRKLVYPLV